MQDLDKNSIYALTAEELEKLQTIFVADYCSDDEGKAFIKEAFNEGYLMDPHTATCC
jgi:threonine synthase